MNNIKEWWTDKDLQRMLREDKIDMEIYYEIAQRRNSVKEGIFIAFCSVALIVVIAYNVVH